MGQSNNVGCRSVEEINLKRLCRTTQDRGIDSGVKTWRARWLVLLYRMRGSEGEVKSESRLVKLFHQTIPKLLRLYQHSPTCATSQRRVCLYLAMVIFIIADSKALELYQSRNVHCVHHFAFHESH